MTKLRGKLIDPVQSRQWDVWIITARKRSIALLWSGLCVQVGLLVQEWALSKIEYNRIDTHKKRSSRRGMAKPSAETDSAVVSRTILLAAVNQSVSAIIDAAIGRSTIDYQRELTFRSTHRSTDQCPHPLYGYCLAVQCSLQNGFTKWQDKRITWKCGVLHVLHSTLTDCHWSDSVIGVLHWTESKGTSSAYLRKTSKYGITHTHGT